MQKYSLGLLELKNKKLQLVLLHRSRFFQTKAETLTDNLHKNSIYLLVDEDGEDWFIVSVQVEKEITCSVGSEDINSFRQIDPFGKQLVLRKQSRHRTVKVWTAGVISLSSDVIGLCKF